MNLDELLREQLTSLTDRLREEAARQVSEATEALVASAAAEQAVAVAKAAADARAVAEQAAAEMLATTEQRAREEGRKQGIAEGRQLGRDEGLEKGRAAGLEEGLGRGREEGHAEAEDRVRQAREDGEAAGMATGLEQGRKEGFETGLEEGRARGREDGLSQGREESRAEGLADGRAEGIEVGLARARQEASAQRQAESLAAAASLPGSDSGERLVEGLRLIDDASSLSSILNALTTSASRELPRVSVLLVTGDRLRSWRFVGFGSTLDESSAVELPIAQAGVIEEAVRTQSVALGNSSDEGGAPSFADLPPGRQMLAVPVALGGHVVAVLYADQGPDQEVGDGAVVWAHTLDALARHTARCLESVTAVRTVQLATGGTTHQAPGQSPRMGVNEEQESARRCARLLVSEIKLHHHSAVAVGRRERDLGSRLGGEIARARAQYEQRVPEHVRRAGDYFQDELVSTLAGGDETLLVDG